MLEIPETFTMLTKRRRLLGGVGNTIKQIADDYTEAKGLFPRREKVGRDLRAMGEGVITQLQMLLRQWLELWSAALGSGGWLRGACGGQCCGAVVGSLVGGSAGNALVEGAGRYRMLCKSGH